jgi:hypothetical protein
LTSFGLIPLKEIWAMLDRCAPGHRRKAREHNYLITYEQFSYPSFPLGKHGKRENPTVQVGHVRQLVRQLQLEVECVKRWLPQLKLK